MDKVVSYKFNPEKGALEPNQPPYATVHPGAGPRHFAFHPGGHFACVIGELDNTITAFGYVSSRGVLNELQSITTLPKDFTGANTAAKVQVHPPGKFLYGSNRGHNSIAVFAVDARKGTLTVTEHVPTQGKTPRHFGIDPADRFFLAAHQDRDNVVVFSIDQKTAHLPPTGQVLERMTPTCAMFLPPKVRSIRQHREQRKEAQRHGASLSEVGSPPIQVLTTFHGGQGTSNTNRWSPDSKKYACVACEKPPEQGANAFRGSVANSGRMTRHGGQPRWNGNPTGPAWERYRPGINGRPMQIRLRPRRPALENMELSRLGGPRPGRRNEVNG